MLLRMTPTLPLLQINPGRLCLGPDLVCNSKCCPEVYREVHQQGSGPGKLPWEPNTVEQASSKMRQGLSLLCISTEVYRPSTNPASLPWLPEKAPLQYLDNAAH